MNATAGDRQATITWVAPTTTGGSLITGYTITSNPVSQSSPLVVGNVLTATMTGLTNGRAYTFTVKAVNSAGTGAASSSSGSVTPSTAPGTPTIVNATAGDRQATITWGAPTTTAGV